MQLFHFLYTPSTLSLFLKIKFLIWVGPDGGAPTVI